MLDKLAEGLSVELEKISAEMERLREAESAIMRAIEVLGGRDAREKDKRGRASASGLSSGTMCLTEFVNDLALSLDDWTAHSRIYAAVRHAQVGGKVKRLRRPDEATGRVLRRLYKEGKLLRRGGRKCRQWRAVTPEDRSAGTRDSMT